ncbi:MAG: F0F1 ATP synthase subunit B [Planctomycetaceae bacterium]|nr:F0F1 ATP synthase subunit B [Planctomycetaceae bacterium]
MIASQWAWALLLASTGGEGANPLEWKSDLALWTGVVFVLLLLILWRFAWKPIAEGLDKRERNVADQIGQAESANQKAKDLLADYERKLAEAGQQVRELLDQGRRQAEQSGRVLIEKAKAEAQVEYDRALKQIDVATSAAIKELAGQSATLAVDLAGKIVQAKLNAGDHARLIEQAVAGFVQSRN